MKNTEAQILEKAKQVMADLDGKYYSPSNIVKAIFKAKKNITGNQKIDAWTIVIESLFDSLDFLTISDETGEPVYYQNANMIINYVEKSADGKYVLKK